MVEDFSEFCDTFAKNALQEVLLSSGLAKGVWDHTILPGGVSEPTNLGLLYILW